MMMLLQRACLVVAAGAVACGALTTPPPRALAPRAARALPRHPTTSARRPRTTTTTMNVLDVGRTNIRLDGYSRYSVVAALLMNSAMRLLTSTNIDLEARGVAVWKDRVVQALFVTSMALSIFSGVYTTVVFTLVGMYAKVALGYQLDAECGAFLAVTRPYREKAFQSFILSLVSFSVAFPLSLFLKMKGKTRWIVLVATLGVAFWMCTSWFAIMGIANEAIYKPRFLRETARAAAAVLGT